MPSTSHPRPTLLERARFAGALLTGSVALGLVQRAMHRPASAHVVWTAGASLAVTLLVPGIGRWAFVGWTALGSALRAVVSRFLLAVFFGVVLIPAAALLRLFGHDPLKTGAPTSGTYWRTRGAPRAPSSYFRQY
jgi:hypothetical protein